MIPRLNKHAVGGGSNEPLPEPRALHAGPLAMVYEAGDLRYLRLGSREVVRRIYAAVRDRNWGTVPCRLRNEVIEAHADSFRISYLAQHRQGDIHFEWAAEIRGEAEGILTFSFDGEAKSTFWKNRVGFCVLHPIEECAGLKCRVEHVDGTLASARFPEDVAAAQPVSGFADLRAIHHRVGPGLRVEIRLEGDVFEMEDQRNWIDASYKTSCTPLRIPFPVQLKAGTRVQQRVRVRLSGSTPVRPSLRKRRSAYPKRGSDEIIVEVKSAGVSLPPIGLGTASHGEPLTFPEVERLRRLHLSHLRTDLKLSQANWLDQFRMAIEQSEDLNVSLEVALFLAAKDQPELRRLARELGQLRPDVVRWIVFDPALPASGDLAVTLARKYLAQLCPAALFGSGSNADFYQLNQGRPSMRKLDFIAFPMNPQAHAFDNRSLAETPEAVPATLATARALGRGLPVVVSPVTLKPRFNPVATGPEPLPSPGALPAQVDPRQVSLFGAGWTLASLRRLIEGQVAAATYYETTGWRGLMERAAGSPLPGKFPSLAGGVFPLYHVFACLGDFKGGRMMMSRSSQPLQIQALALRAGPRQSLLVTNLTPQPQRVAIRGFAPRTHGLLMDTEKALDAMLHPDRWSKELGNRYSARRGHLHMDLPPYALLRLTGSP